MAVELAALLIGDEPQVWSDLGFVVEGGAVHVSGVRHVLGGDKRGIRDWSVRGADVDEIDGFPLGLPAADPEPTPDHPNGVVGLDHVVFATPDLTRTIGALEGAGLELRRTRDAGQGQYGVPMRQAFFKMGEVILEVVGPAEPQGDGPPRFFGLAWTVRDLDETARFLGERLHRAKDAVQPGRRIATLDKPLGKSSVAMAFMTPEP
ncbi:MAG TPA: hypothetical protein VM345_10920 [Acidimicrobiales bacterium]|jgi:hypothetical protein|nr:hypothetical protein [Acidimicrobiales bacterium]